jgi:hypothetical protein
MAEPEGQSSEQLLGRGEGWTALPCLECNRPWRSGEWSSARIGVALLLCNTRSKERELWELGPGENGVLRFRDAGLCFSHWARSVGTPLTKPYADTASSPRRFLRRYLLQLHPMQNRSSSHGAAKWISEPSTRE